MKGVKRIDLENKGITIRHLNKKQKKLLDEWYEENKDLPGLGIFDLVDCEQFCYGFLIGLRDINDFETIHDHVNQHISKKTMNSLK